MGAQGNIEINFGAGNSDASYTVTAADLSVTGLVTTSDIEAWVEPKATTDHSADEHVMEELAVFADKSSIVAGTSFVVRAVKRSNTVEIPLGWLASGNKAGPAGRVNDLRGKWNVGVVWN